MILEGNQRGGAKNLALHLMKEENEHVEVHEIRGFASGDLMGALNEAYAVSRGTECTQFLYSLSLNPPQDAEVKTSDFEAAINKVEADLNLQGQPRAIVFHEKEGRRHAHAVWSRIDIEHMKAIPMSHDHLKLQAVSRELYIQHDWKMPRGFAKQSERDPTNFTLAEWQQAKRGDKDPRAIKTAITDAWAISDNKASFSHALEERGYVLAKGDKQGRIVAVDVQGEVYSIPNQINSIRIKQVRDRIGDEQDLSSVQEAKRKIANNMLPTLERFKIELSRKQEGDSAAFKHERQDLIEMQRRKRAAFNQKQQNLRQQQATERQGRFKRGLSGVWDRLRGEHKRIKEQNQQEAAQAQKHAQGQKDRFIQGQLEQRRQLTAQARAKQHSRKQEHKDVQRDITAYWQEQAQPPPHPKTQPQTLKNEFAAKSKNTEPPNNDRAGRREAFMQKRSDANQTIPRPRSPRR